MISLVNFEGMLSGIKMLFPLLFRREMFTTNGAFPLRIGLSVSTINVHIIQNTYDKSDRIVHPHLALVIRSREREHYAFA